MARKATIINRPKKGHRSGEVVVTPKASKSPTEEQYQALHRATHGGSLAGYTGASGTVPQMPAPTYDSQYWNELASGQADYDTGMAGIGLQRGRVAFDTGYGADGRVDLSNPYSQGMLLQRNADQAGLGIKNSMAARGQLYSGAHQGAQDENNFQYERNRSALATGAQRAYEDLALDEQGLGNSLANSRYGAGAGQADRWTQQQRDWFELYG